MAPKFSSLGRGNASIDKAQEEPGPVPAPVFRTAGRVGNSNDLALTFGLPARADLPAEVGKPIAAYFISRAAPEGGGDAFADLADAEAVKANSEATLDLSEEQLGTDVTATIGSDLTRDAEAEQSVCVIEFEAAAA